MARAFSRNRLLAQTCVDDYGDFSDFGDFVRLDDSGDVFYQSAKTDEFAKIDDFAELSVAIANYQMECTDEMCDAFIEIIHKEEVLLNDLSKFII